MRYLLQKPCTCCANASHSKQAFQWILLSKSAILTEKAFENAFSQMPTACRHLFSKHYTHVRHSWQAFLGNDLNIFENHLFLAVFCYTKNRAWSGAVRRRGNFASMPVMSLRDPVRGRGNLRQKSLAASFGDRRVTAFLAMTRTGRSACDFSCHGTGTFAGG